MRSLLARVGAGIGLSCIVLTTGPARAEVAASASLPSRAFGKVVERALRQCDVPGAVAGVWTGNDSWLRAFGLADVGTGRKVRVTDRFAIRSVTKSFVVTRVLQLAAAGRVALDDPISAYYPGVPNGHRITLRHLANMTSGLFNYTRDPAWQKAFVANPLRRWTDPEIIAYALAHKPNFQPGAAYEYSNTNTLLLGRVIKKVTTRPVGPTLATHIFDPLKLGSTSYLYGTRIPNPRVLGYQGFENGRPANFDVNFTSLGASGAMASTAADLRVWGRALVEGTLLPAKLQRQRFVARRPTNGPEYDRYGLGMGMIDGWWGHTGEGAGFEAAVFHKPGTKSTIVILLNAANRKDVPAHILRRFIKILETGSEGSLAGKPICD